MTDFTPDNTAPVKKTPLAVAATFATILAGANNDLAFTAKTAGAAGNAITVALVDPAGNNQALAVNVVASAISVSLATGAGGAITSTAALVKAAVEASGAAAALVTVAHKTGNDGTGVVTAMAATNLVGGYDNPSPSNTPPTAKALDYGSDNTAPDPI